MGKVYDFTPRKPPQKATTRQALGEVVAVLLLLLALPAAAVLQLISWVVSLLSGVLIRLFRHWYPPADPSESDDEPPSTTMP